MKIVIIVSIVLPGSSTPTARQRISKAVKTLSADQVESAMTFWLEGRQVYNHIVSNPSSVSPSYPVELRGSSSLRKYNLMRNTVRLSLLMKKTTAMANTFQKLKSSKTEQATQTMETARSAKEAQFCLRVKKETRKSRTLLMYSTSMLKATTQMPQVILLEMLSLVISKNMLMKNCSISRSDTDSFLNWEHIKVKMTMFLKSDQFRNNYQEKFQKTLDSTKHFSSPEPKNLR